MLVPQALLLALAVTPPLEVVPRTPPASATPAAQVVMSFGSTTATPPGGGGVALAPGMVVDRAERIGVGTNSWVVLAVLANGHLVRLDEEVTLTVSEIALLDLPPTTESAAKQLERLLTQREKTTEKVPERLVGWHAGLSAANVKRKEESPRDEGSAKQPRRDEEPTSSWWPPSWVRSWLQKEDGSRSGERSASDEGGPRRQAPKPVGGAPARERTASEEAKSTPGRPLQQTADASGGGGPAQGAPSGSARMPAAPGPLVVDELLRACVQGEYASLSEATRKALGSALVLTFRLNTSGEARVTLPGALPPPACVLEWAGAHAAQLTREPTPLTVQVK